MQNYALHYDYNENKYDLIILFKNKTFNTVIKFDIVDVFYADDEVVTYVIHGINNFMKIYSKGVIHSPLKEMIDVINSILKKAKLSTLPYKENSGFIIGRIISENQIDLGNTTIETICPKDLIDAYVVIATPNTFISRDKYVSDYHLCSYNDLNISESDEVFVIDEQCSPGKDFYLWEAK